MELARKVGNILIIGGLFLFVTNILLIFTSTYNLYILLLIMVSLTIGLWTSLSSYSIHKKYRVKSKSNIIAGIFVSFIIIIPTTLFFILREPNVKIDNSKISLEGIYGNHILTKEVHKIKLINVMPPKEEKINGIEMLGISRGIFRFKEWDDVYLILQTPKAPYVLIETQNGRRLVFNSSNREKTTAYYHTMVKNFNLNN